MTSKFLKRLDHFKEGDFTSVVLDIETTIVDNSPRIAAGARPHVVGILSATTSYYISSPRASLGFLKELLDTTDRVVLIGHNIKFDIGHLLHWYRDETEEILRHPALVGVWDTMLCTYLHSAQVHIMPSLDFSLNYFNVTTAKKDDLVTENYFSKGLGADLVPEDVLREYLENDLKITLELFDKQWVELPDRLIPHMFVQGWATVAYSRMEANGLPLDVSECGHMHVEYEEIISKREQLIQRWVQAKLGTTEDIKVTNRTLSTVFFGEPGVPVKTKRVVGMYKNGKPKTAVSTDTLKPKAPLVFPEDVFGTGVEMHSDTLGYRMDEKVLKNIESMMDPSSVEHKILGLILSKKALAKVQGTYLTPFLRQHKDGTIHHQINQAVAATGRTTSSSPNGQNMPSEVRKLVKVPGRVIMQADFSQLEMQVAAELSKDPVMLYDVEHKDVHFETGKDVFGWKTEEDMTKGSRRIVKGVNFGTIYGGSPAAIAEQTGASEKIVRDIQDSFKKRYPHFSAWQAHRVEEARMAAGRGPVKHDEDGQCYYYHYVLSPSGREYALQESKHPFTGKPSVSPTIAKNYPVQGFATGDIVPLFIAYTLGMPSPLLDAFDPINAVHDSIVGLTDFLTHTIASTYLNTYVINLRPLVKEVYDVNLSLDFKLDIEISDTWH